MEWEDGKDWKGQRRGRNTLKFPPFHASFHIPTVSHQRLGKIRGRESVTSQPGIAVLNQGILEQATIKLEGYITRTCLFPLKLTLMFSKLDTSLFLE